MRTAIRLGTESGHRIGRCLLFVVGVSFACAVPAAQAASGRICLFTANPDLEAGTKGFGGFLRGLGYTVVVEESGGGPYEALDTNPEAAARIAELEAYDLVVIHRNFGSTTLASTEAEIAIWNRMRVPILLCNAPMARNNRWRWIDAGSGSILASPRLIIEDPAHPIVAGLENDLFKADTVYGGVVLGDDGGPHMSIIARANIPGFDPICLAVWDEGQGEERPFYAAGGQGYVRRRVFFEMHEYRNNPNAATVDAWGEVSENGRLMFANAVEYAMRGSVGADAPPRISSLDPPKGAENHVAAAGMSFRVTSGQPVATNGITVTLNGVDITPALDLTGSPTNWLVTYDGLEANQAYAAVIHAESAAGGRTITLMFDTLEAAQTLALPTWDSVSFEGNVPAGVYRLYLRAEPLTAQHVTLHEGWDPAQALRGQMDLPIIDPEAPRMLVPVADALGATVAYRLAGDLHYTIDSPALGTLLADELVLVPVADPGALLPPLLVWASPAPGQTDASPVGGFDLVLLDRDAGLIPSSIQLLLNGAPVPGQIDIVDTEDGAEAHVSPDAFLVPGSQNTARVSCRHGVGPGELTDWEYSFGVRPMPVIPAEYAGDPGSGLDPGFTVRNHMAPDGDPALFINTSARAELQLAGQLLDGVGNPVVNQIDGTPLPAEFAEPGVINYARDPGTPAGRFGGDALFPGAGAELIAANIALEAVAYLELSAGLHRFGVRSDDGFRLTAGADLGAQDLLLGVYEGPRGDQVPTEFEILVMQEGVYALRLLYYDGGGGASLEWYGIYDGLVSPDGTDGRVLINGADAGGSVRVPAYRARSSGPGIEPPVLHCAIEGGELVLSWSSTLLFQLETTASLANPDWQPVPEPPVVVGDQYTVRIQPVAGAAFYRLQR